jgi:hypothetical protein
VTSDRLEILHAVVLKLLFNLDIQCQGAIVKFFDEAQWDWRQWLKLAVGGSNATHLSLVKGGVSSA